MAYNQPEDRTASNSRPALFQIYPLSSKSKKARTFTLPITLNSDFLVKVTVSFSQNYKLSTRKREQSTINPGEGNQHSKAVKSNLVLTTGNRLLLD